MRPHRLFRRAALNALLADLHAVHEPDPPPVGVAGRGPVVAVAQAVAVPLLGAVHVHACRRAVAVANAVAVPLLGAVGVKHGWAAVAMQLTVAVPLLAAAREHAGRAVLPVKAAVAVAPLEHALAAELGGQRSAGCKSAVPGRAPGPGRACTSRASSGQPHFLQMRCSSISPPQPRWTGTTGGPSGYAWRSPHFIRAKTTGQRSTPFSVSRYSWRGGRSW